MKVNNDNYKIYFENPLEDSIDLNLDNLNIVNIENMDQFHKIPVLQHNLEIVVEKPGLYTLEELRKLQDDNGKFLQHIYQP